MATSTQPRSARRAGRSRREAAPAPITWTRDPVILGAAAIGLLVSIYLLLVDLSGGSTLCLAGADCDIVRASAYGHVFGLPMALLGVGYFVAVGAAALVRASWQPRLLQLLGGAGLGAALLFVSVQGLVLKAWCPYCLVADAAALVVGLRTVLPGWTGWQRTNVSPGQLPVARGGLAQGLLGAVLAVALLLLGYAVSPATTTAVAASDSTSTSGGNTDQLAALADHLRESGAVFYGAYWCPHCQNQKAMFGAAATRLPYVECDPRGTNSQPAACQAAGVQAYPTWIIGGQKLEGEIPLSELARRSGFAQ